jgi:hypothetical protein
LGSLGEKKEGGSDFLITSILFWGVAVNGLAVADNLDWVVSSELNEWVD